VEFRVQDVLAHTAAKSCSGVCNCHVDCVTLDLVRDREPVAVGTTIPRSTKIYEQSVLKKVAQARVTRGARFRELMGYASGNLHNRALRVVGAYRPGTTRPQERGYAESKKNQLENSHGLFQ
jgi:hypothetical protein